MKKMIHFLLLIVCVASFSFPQTMSQDEKTVLVTAQGWGKKEGDTRMNAMRTGVEAVIRDMLSTPEERTKFREQKEAFLAEAEKYVIDYDIKRKMRQRLKRNGKKYKMTMTIELRINKEELRKALEDRDLIQASSELRRRLDNFTLMPYVDEEKSHPYFTEKKDLVYARIGSFLQNQHIPFIGEEEIKNIEANEEIIALGKSTSTDEGEEDLLLQLARCTKADFYIKIVGHVEGTLVAGESCKKVSISVTAYTVMTAENIASQTGYSELLCLSSKDASISVGIEQAVNSTMHDIMDKLRLSWKDYVKGGRPYKLVFYDFEFSEFAKIHHVLKEDMALRVKLLKKAGNIASFIVWYNGPLADLLFEVPGKVGLKLKEDPAILGNTLRFFRENR